MKENVFPTPPLFVNGSFFKKASIFTLFFADHHFSLSTLPTKLSSATDGHLYFLIFNEDNIFMIIKALNIIKPMVKMRFQYG